jgi:hypothetical protein
MLLNQTPEEEALEEETNSSPPLAKAIPSVVAGFIPA